jgi:exonuclease III
LYPGNQAKGYVDHKQFLEMGYHDYVFGTKKGYSGVAVFTESNPIMLNMEQVIK